MIFLNKENIYENDLVKQSKVDWQERKYAKCPLCPADISDENFSCTTSDRKRRHQRDAFDNLSDANFSIPATLLNGGILSIAGCGFPGVQNNSDNVKFKRRNNNRTLETFKTLSRHKRVIEPDAMLGPKRTFPCTGCPINMLPFTVRRNSEKDSTTSCRKIRLSKNPSDANKSVSRSVSVGSRVTEQKSKRRQFKILETDESELKKTKSSSFCKSPSRGSSRRSSRLKRHHSLLSVRKRHRRRSVTPAPIKTSFSVETQVSFTEEEKHHKSIPRASNRSSKNILNCTYENRSSQIEDEIPPVTEPPGSFMDPTPNKTQQSIERGGESSENIRESFITESEVVQTDSNQSPPNVTVKNVQLENNGSINDFRSENCIVENTNDSLHLKSSQDLSVAEQTRLNNSFDQNVQESHSDALERSVQELHLKNSVDLQEEPSTRFVCRSFPEGFTDSLTMRNNYIDDAINKAKTHDFLHEFYQEMGNEEFDREMFDDESDEDLKQRSDDQLIIIDSSASDVHEDNPIMSEDEKRAILEEMVGPRINYFKFDSETDNDDASPCGKYLNKLPQVFRIKTNGELKKFEIENIVRQYRYSYLVRIMNKCPKPDLRLRRCRRSERSERYYLDSSIKKKRLLGRSEHSKLQRGSSRRLVKKTSLCDKRMKKELGPATIWNGPTPSRRKLEAPKFCQTLDYNALFDVQFDSKQADRTKLPGPPTTHGGKDPSLFDNLQSTSHQNVIPMKNPLLVGEVWNMWEMDCIQNYLKTCTTSNDKDESLESKVNLPKRSDTKGKSCPFSPWPCPLGPICPFPPSKNDDDDMRKESGPCQHSKTGCTKRSDFNPSPDVADIIKEIKKFKESSFLDMPTFPKPCLSGNGVKKVKSVIVNKVSIGTVTSCECVVLPKCRFKRKKVVCNRDELAEHCDNFKTRRRMCDRRKSKSEHNMAKKMGKYWYRSRKDNTYHALRLSAFPGQPPCEGHVCNNYHVTPDDRCIKLYPPRRNFAIRDRRNTPLKRADDSQRTGRIRCSSSEEMVKVKRHKAIYGSSARRIKKTHTSDDFDGYPQMDCLTEDCSECQQCWEVSSEDRQWLHSDRDTPTYACRKNVDFLPTEKYTGKYDTKKTSVFPVKYQRSSSSEYKRSTRETRLRMRSFEPRSDAISKDYHAHSSNVMKHRNREFRRSNSSHLFRNDFFNELSFYADPHFPKPNFISYNTSLYHRRSRISCLPPSVASKIILNNDKCMLKNNNPVFLSERTNTCTSCKGQDRSRVKRASGKHVDYF
ncbi:uncharacterized protein LOC106662996 [Cimex lectularius]|uniref:Uncharacterized protein n=1 Tax=Cimex lectularius TaxID=79782 RepID=A0A8I6RBL4_CIMLE|nr:uncharacterized protein LOC106662996 [Cimex lectularius]